MIAFEFCYPDKDENLVFEDAEGVVGCTMQRCVFIISASRHLVCSDGNMGNVLAFFSPLD